MNSKMTFSVVVDIHIAADEYLRWYAGSAHTVLATARDGRKVSFPAKILHKYVTHDGISGSFVICFSEDNRFLNIDRL